MSKIQFLLVGESWVSNSTHYKGWDFFSSTIYETGVEYLAPAFKDSDIEFLHMPSHIASSSFPFTVEELEQYDVICLSDIGANTLLLHPDTWLHGKPTPNRLKVIADWVNRGGGFMMCGGYMSFSGINSVAKYQRTPIEEILPVKIFNYDDRVETPEGAKPNILLPDHPIIKGIGTDWPLLLGFNELKIKPEAQLIATIEDHPLLAVHEVNKGRSLIWASDIGPHWCPSSFAEWEGYKNLWTNVVMWLSAR